MTPYLVISWRANTNVTAHQSAFTFQMRSADDDIDVYLVPSSIHVNWHGAIYETASGVTRQNRSPLM